MTFARTVAAILMLGNLLAVTTVSADKRAFGIEDFYRVKNPSHIEVSPDGKWLVYELRTTDLRRGESNRDLYRLSLRDGGEPQRLTWTDSANESAPSWSPDGAQIAFVSRRGEQDEPQIWLLPARGGEARSLTDLSTGVSDPIWSPDGKRIAFVSDVYPDCGADDLCNRERDEARREGPLTVHVADDLLFRHWNGWSDGKRAHLLVVEIESGEVRDLTPGASDAPVFSVGGMRGFAFSPDGKELCFTRNGDPERTHAWSTNSDLWVVPVEPDADGAARPPRNLTRGNLAWDGGPRYSPDGRHIAFLRQLRPGYESDRFRLVVLDRESGEIRDLTPEHGDRVDAFRWLLDGSGLIFTAPFEGRKPLYRVSVQGGQIRRIADFATIDAVAPTPGGDEAIALRRSMAQPREIWSLDLSGRRPPRRLSEHNAALEREVDIRPGEPMWIETEDGRRLHLFLIKPHDFDPARKYPLILNVRGGPQGMWGDAFRGDWQVYPGAGYIVAAPNPTGSTGFGQAFTDAIRGDWGGRVFEDLMTITDALERLPYVDGERMGAMGWSYGGYMMNWFQGHTDRFAVLAGMMGIFDLPTFYYTTEELWFPEWDMNGSPSSSEAYRTWNPAEAADRFRTPMLIVTGERDFRIPYTQSLMAFTALRRRDVPARLVVLPDAGHWPGWYEMALYYTAHLDWFHRFLGGEPPPWTVEQFAGNTAFGDD